VTPPDRESAVDDDRVWSFEKSLWEGGADRYRELVDDETYEAHCTSTYRRLSHEEWRVVQHQQTPRLAIPSQEG
jgi:hypothetical protein